MEERFSCFMPISKSNDGELISILSDTSLDRDEEFMTKELLDDWASDNVVLPMLANHENKIEKLIGGWNDKRVVSKGDNHALVAKPFFLESNPLGRQTKEMVEEANRKGLNIGISIAAIPKKSIEKDINGKKCKGYTQAEIVEATIIPIQSNRNSFMAIAKSFDIIEKPKQVEDCVKALMSDPEFKPKDGNTKEESAYAVCQSKFGKECAQEEIKMPEEIKIEKTNESDLLKSEVEFLKKEINDLKTKSVNLQPTFEKPVIKEVDEPLTINKMLKLARGGK